MRVISLTRLYELDRIWQPGEALEGISAERARALEALGLVRIEGDHGSDPEPEPQPEQVEPEVAAPDEPPAHRMVRRGRRKDQPEE